MKKLLLSLSVMLLGVLAVQAQIKTPSASPTAKLETTVGLTDVHVLYSRPSMKGRTIFGTDALVPYGEIWRTGANQATKVTFGGEVTVAGAKMPAGDYAILTKPMADEWMFMFYPYEGGSWGSYTSKTPAGTVSGKVTKLSVPVESFTIDVNHYSMNGAHLTFTWDKTRVALPIETDVESAVMANIDRVMAGPSTNDYYAAATFLHDSGKDLDKALTYINKVTMGDDPKYWQVRRKALILADLGKKTEAIAAAKQSLSLAEKAGNMDYVRMNKKSLTEWGAKM